MMVGFLTAQYDYTLNLSGAASAATPRPGKTAVPGAGRSLCLPSY